MREFLKKYWFPCLFFAVLIVFATYTAWKENRVKSGLIEESLRCNRYVIAILAQYEKPWKLDERILQETIQGNPNVLEVLKISKKGNR